MAESVARIQAGNIGLIICCVIYLIWWSISYNPEKEFSTAPKVILFIFTFAAGLFGVIATIWGMTSLESTRGVIPTWAIVVAGAAAYVILLVLTYLLMHRQVTAELFLITGWTVLEVCIMNRLFRAGALGSVSAVSAVIMVIAAAAAAMICYLAYYNLEAVEGFHVAMVPLILFAIIMLFEVILTRVCLLI